MTAKPTDLDNRSKIHRRSKNAAATILTITALVFATYSVADMSSQVSYVSSLLQAAYAQEQQQDQ